MKPKVFYVKRLASKNYGQWCVISHKSVQYFNCWDSAIIFALLCSRTKPFQGIAFLSACGIIVVGGEMNRAELNSKYSAFVVFFDAVDGAMEVWPKASMDIAQIEADRKQTNLDASGYEECGHYRALPQLPQKRVYKVHQP